MIGRSFRSRVVAFLCLVALVGALLPVGAFAASEMYVKTSTGESVNIHSSMDYGSYNVVGHVPYSGKVTVNSYHGSWAYITYNKVSGYIQSEFLVSSEPIKKSVTAPTKTYSMYVATSNKKALNIRSAMSTKSSANIVGTVDYGKRVTVLSTHGNWAYIKSGSTKGYVLKSMLSDKAPTTSKASSTSANSKGVTRYISTANKKGVNFRSTAAKKGSNIIKVLPYGTRVTAYETKGSWTRIKYGNRYGYVQTSFLSSKKP